MTVGVRNGRKGDAVCRVRDPLRRHVSLAATGRAVWTHRAGCGKTNGKCNLMLTNVKQQTELGLSDAVVHTLRRRGRECSERGRRGTVATPHLMRPLTPMYECAQ